jgi:hypothetical protein
MYLANGYRGLFPRGKAVGREADYSLPSSKRSLGYVFMAWYLVKHRHNFTFTISWHSKFFSTCDECKVYAVHV